MDSKKNVDNQSTRNTIIAGCFVLLAAICTFTSVIIGTLLDKTIEEKATPEPQLILNFTARIWPHDYPYFFLVGTIQNDKAFDILVVTNNCLSGKALYTPNNKFRIEPTDGNYHSYLYITITTNSDITLEELNVMFGRVIAFQTERTESK